MEHLIYIYIIINAAISGYYYGDSYQRRSDIIIGILGLVFALPLVIISFTWEFLKLCCYHIDGVFQISFIWQIRNGHYKNLPKRKLEYLNKVVLKAKEKPKLSFADRRGIYCANKINELNNYTYDPKKGDHEGADSSFD